MADITVLTEAPISKKPIMNSVRFTDAKFGVFVMGSDRYRVEEGHRQADVPCAYPVRVSGGVSFNLLAVWTWRAPSYRDALLRGIGTYRDWLKNGPSVVTGDFNGGPSYDRPKTRKRWQEPFDDLAALGLKSAYHAFRGVACTAEGEPTYYHRNDRQHPFHIDFCFVPEAWTSSGLKVTVGDYEGWSR